MTQPTWPATAASMADVVAAVSTWANRATDAADAFPVLRDPAIGPEPTVDELLEESRQIAVEEARQITVTDPLCGHLPGECWGSAECAYWRGVVLGEYPAPEGMETVVEQVRAQYAARRGLVPQEVAA